MAAKKRRPFYTDREVLGIRIKLLAGYSLTDIANEFGKTASSISFIADGKTFEGLKSPGRGVQKKWIMFVKARLKRHAARHKAREIVFRKEKRRKKIALTKRQAKTVMQAPKRKYVLRKAVREPAEIVTFKSKGKRKLAKALKVEIKEAVVEQPVAVVSEQPTEKLKLVVAPVSKETHPAAILPLTVRIRRRRPVNSEQS